LQLQVVPPRVVLQVGEDLCHLEDFADLLPVLRRAGLLQLLQQRHHLRGVLLDEEQGRRLALLREARQGRLARGRRPRPARRQRPQHAAQDQTARAERRGFHGWPLAQWLAVGGLVRSGGRSSVWARRRSSARPLRRFSSAWTLTRWSLLCSSAQSRAI